MITICHNILSHRLDREVVSLCQPLDYSLIHSRALRSVVDTLANALNTAKWPTRDQDKAWKEEALVGLCAIFHNVLSRDRFVGIGDGVKAIFLALSEEYDERRGEMFLRVLLLEPPEEASYWDITYLEAEKAISLINGLMKTATSIFTEPDRQPILPPVYGTESSKEQESGEKGALEALLIILIILSRRTESDENLASHSEVFSEFIQSWRTYVDQHEIQQYHPRSRKSNRRKELLQRLGDYISTINQDVEDFITPDIIEFLGEKFGLDTCSVNPRNFTRSYTPNVIIRDSDYPDDYPLIPPSPPAGDYLPAEESSRPIQDHDAVYDPPIAIAPHSITRYRHRGYFAQPQNYVILPRNIMNRGETHDINHDNEMHEQMVAYPVTMVSDFRENEHMDGTVRIDYPLIHGPNRHRGASSSAFPRRLPPRRNTS
ncbi:hypothetical protein C8Q75DRAFT_147065 [Abortiporus biennis]|nr:hypothetical protein C8Q75DRAFT_147065 [Abortiporus biennis]